MMWWQPFLDALPPLTNGGTLAVVLALFAGGRIWTRASVQQALRQVEHERDQALTDRDFFRDAWMEEQRVSRGYADTAVRAAVPAAAAAQKHLEGLERLAGGGGDG